MRPEKKFNARWLLENEGKFYRRKELAKLFGVCEATIRRHVRMGTFPPPIVTVGGELWSKEMLEQYFADRAGKS